MANEYVNKVTLSTGEVLIDLTGDTVTAADILTGKKAHDKSGAPLTGSCTFDSDTSDATASASEILASKTAYVAGNKITGSMTNRGAVTGVLTSKTAYVIPQGYHDGSGTVELDSSVLNLSFDVTLENGNATVSGIESEVVPDGVSVRTIVVTAEVLPCIETQIKASFNSCL